MELDYVGGKGKGKKGKDKGGNVKYYCYKCNKAVHLARDCWQPPKGKERVVKEDPITRVNGIPKERAKVPKALRLKEKERARTSLARITPWRVMNLKASNSQMERNGLIIRPKKEIGLLLRQLMKSQVSMEPSV